MTAEMARAASAKAGAPGAQGVLPKVLAYEGGSRATDEVGCGNRTAAWPLQLEQGQATPTALHNEGFVSSGYDSAHFRTAGGMFG